MEDLQGAAAMRGRDVDPAAVGPFQRFLGVGNQGDSLADRLRETVVGKPDLVELLFGIWQGDIDDAGLDVLPAPSPSAPP